MDVNLLKNNIAASRNKGNRLEEMASLYLTQVNSCEKLIEEKETERDNVLEEYECLSDKVMRSNRQLIDDSWKNMYSLRERLGSSESKPESIKHFESRLNLFMADFAKIQQQLKTDKWFADNVPTTSKGVHRG